MKLSIVIPVYNEEGNISLIYDRIYKTMKKIKINYEIIFINDGSTDKSYDIMKSINKNDKKVKLINFSRNFGHHIAVTAGMDYATGDAVVLMDCDLQDPPELIPDLIKKWEEGYKIIYTTGQYLKNISFFKRITSKLFQKILMKITNINIPFGSGIFSLIDKKVLDNLRLIRERHRFIKGLIGWLGFKQTKVEYIREKRHTGQTKYKLGKMILLAIDSITAFSISPLRIATYFGFFISGISLCYGIYLIIGRIFFNKFLISMGWPSIMIAILFLGGVQLITLGIIGEYIGRIYNETKRRPLYVISEKLGI